MIVNTTTINGVDIKKETVLEVGKFTILWNIFEKHRCKYNYKCKEINSIELSHLYKLPFEKFASVLKDRALTKGLTIKTYVENKLYPKSNAIIRKDDKEIYMPIVIDFINSAGRTQLEGAILAIHRIRNNMFHGLKWYDELDEQINLFRAMNAVLEEVIK